MKGIGIVDSTLRDAQQSLWQGKLAPEDVAPILGKIDAAGYHSIEVWGGDVFAASLRHLRRDPWEVLRAYREGIRNTPLQATIKGMYLVGSEPNPLDIVERFICKTYDYGVTIFRLFDPLNDWRNLELPIRLVKKAGGHAQASISYTRSPVHNEDYFVSQARQFVKLGVDSICIMDAAGSLNQSSVASLVKAVKAKVGVPVDLHAHYNGGMAIGIYLSAAEAGVDFIDAASAPTSFGISLPPVESLVYCLHEGGYDTRLEESSLLAITDFIEEVRERKGFPRGITSVDNLRAFEHQVPGWILSVVEEQLPTEGIEGGLPSVLEEMARVRADLGYPHLTDFIGRMVADQAVINLKSGERYHRASDAIKNYLRGLYGRPPGPVDPGFIKELVGTVPALKGRPVDYLAYRWDRVRDELKGISDREEDILTYSLFPELAHRLFGPRVGSDQRETEGLDETKVPPAAGRITESDLEEETEVKISDLKELIGYLDGSGITEISLENGDFKVQIKRSTGERKTGEPAESGTLESRDAIPTAGGKASDPQPLPDFKKSGKLIPVIAPIVGRFYRSQAPGSPPFVEVGTRVSPGDALCIVEAMKVMNEVEAEAEGIVVEILAENGKPVEYGQTIMLLAQGVSPGV
ncbi:MAG: acetyl-CoA carboxylase biotin carboxyl carrier protein [Firmicutes bacterium]|nr:acetyl-CoA carboxylase biotin carboxyl carrier protein [Bacillota bacterium]